MKRVLLLAALVVGAGCGGAGLAPNPTLRDLGVIVPPEKLQGASDGTLAVFEGLPTGCRWGRQDPNEAIDFLYTFPSRCHSVELFWDRPATRAVIVTGDANGRSAWLVDLATGRAQEVVVPTSFRVSSGVMESDGTLVLQLYRPGIPRPPTALTKMGLLSACEEGLLRALRWNGGTRFEESGRMTVDCQGNLSGSIADLAPSGETHPGVVSGPGALPNGMPAPPLSRRRGDTAIDWAVTSGRVKMTRPEGETIVLDPGMAEFWPKAVDADWSLHEDWKRYRLP